MNKATIQMSRATALLILLALVALGCGDDNSSSEDSTTDELSPATETKRQDDSAATEDPTPEDDSTPAAESTQETEGDAASDPEDTEPIKLGAISTLTGAASFPESHSAAQAVFDQVNDAGGIAGRMIEYTVEDDGFDPALAAQGARRLADEVGVVAMVGSASVLECAINAQYYAEVGLYSIQGTGIDPVCFTTSGR